MRCACPCGLARRRELAIKIGNRAREAAEALRAAGQDVLADTVLQTTLSGAPGSQMHIAVEEITALAVTLGDDLLSFITERLKVALKADGVRHDLIDAVTALGGQDDLVLLVKRVEALQSFLATEDGTNLLAGYKRAANILAAEEKKGALPEGEANYQSDGAPQTVVRPRYPLCPDQPVDGYSRHDGPHR